MPSLSYWLTTAGESVLGLFGIRAPYEQPPYRIVATLAHGVEIRNYEARTAVETSMHDGRDDQAFGRLFAYITGANTPAKAPPQAIAMTIPVERSAQNTLRFFLPRKVAAAGPPPPRDPRVQVVVLPAETIGALRFSGSLATAEVTRHDLILRNALAAGGWHAIGPTARFGYDPPFTPSFLRRNEVVVTVRR